MRQEHQAKGISDNFVLFFFLACKGEALDCNPKGYHACASFKMEEFNKDYHPQGNHASALRLIKRKALA